MTPAPRTPRWPRTLCRAFARGSRRRWGRPRYSRTQSTPCHSRRTQRCIIFPEAESRDYCSIMYCCGESQRVNSVIPYVSASCYKNNMSYILYPVVAPGRYTRNAPHHNLRTLSCSRVMALIHKIITHIRSADLQNAVGNARIRHALNTARPLRSLCAREQPLLLHNLQAWAVESF
jgi:hypothetical protein